MKQTANNQGQMIANFYTVYQADLVNFAISRLGNREESENLVQDVFIKMMSFEDMATGDIALEMNVSKRTVESQLFTSRKQVRVMLSMAM